MTITRKWIFIFKGSLYHHWLSCHPALLKAFRPFTAMSQKSIAIYSLFGPQATKVNNTVTSSLPAEHGHKTALPLKYNHMQLFIYAGTADCIGLCTAQILQQSHTKRSTLVPYPDRMLGPELKRNLDIHLSFLLQCCGFHERKMGKKIFLKLKGEICYQIHHTYNFSLYNFFKSPGFLKQLAES